MSAFAFARASSSLLHSPRAPSIVYRASASAWRRCISSEVPDVRVKLMTELKSAMKAKDTVTSTTIRSVLSEVYAADKAATSGTATPSAVVSILRKAAQRRTDAATEFTKAARPDLAEKEQREAALLTALLPPLLAPAEIDRVLREVLAEPSVADALAKGPARRALGQVFKAFYARVDKSDVDPDVVRARAQAAVGGSA